MSIFDWCFPARGVTDTNSGLGLSLSQEEDTGYGVRHSEHLKNWSCSDCWSGTYSTAGKIITAPWYGLVAVKDFVVGEWKTRDGWGRTAFVSNLTVSGAVAVVFGLLSYLGKDDDNNIESLHYTGLKITAALLLAINSTWFNFAFAYDFSQRFGDTLGAIRKKIVDLWSELGFFGKLLAAATAGLLVVSVGLAILNLLPALSISFNALGIEGGISNLFSGDALAIAWKSVKGLVAFCFEWYTFATRVVGSFNMLKGLVLAFYESPVWLYNNVLRYFLCRETQKQEQKNLRQVQWDIYLYQDYFKDKHYEDIGLFYQTLFDNNVSDSKAAKIGRFLWYGALNTGSLLLTLCLGFGSLTVAPMFISKAVQGTHDLGSHFAGLSKEEAFVGIAGFPTSLLYAFLAFGVLKQLSNYWRELTYSDKNNTVLAKTKNVGALVGLFIAALATGEGYGQETARLVENGVPQTTLNLLATFGLLNIFNKLKDSGYYHMVVQFFVGVINFMAKIGYNERHLFGGDEGAKKAIEKADETYKRLNDISYQQVRDDAYTSDTEANDHKKLNSAKINTTALSDVWSQRSIWATPDTSRTGERESLISSVNNDAEYQQNVSLTAVLA